MFASFSGITGGGYCSLKENQKVTYAVGQGQKSTQAQNVRALALGPGQKGAVRQLPVGASFRYSGGMEGYNLAGSRADRAIPGNVWRREGDHLPARPGPEIA